MNRSLLQTKLIIPPTRPSLITRQRLIQALNAGLAGKFTLLSAPAGFGKTTLIADWINHSILNIHNSLFSWLSLDVYDDDPNQFWQYVLAALQTAVPHLGTHTQPLLSANPLPPPPVLLTGLLNQLAELPQSIILVLDDYHAISNRQIHDGLDFLLDHTPPQLHLVLLTRADPPLALSRLRARGLLHELRLADLRFTLDETAVFLREKMGLPLSAEDVAALEARTEGWIAGLQLTAVSLQSHPDKSRFIKNFSGSHHFILEYLTEEVLQQQSEAVQIFLLQTSILPRLCAPLCDAVTGRNDSQAILAQLYRQNLFILPLDDNSHWFRTHQLLAELLVNQLRQTATPADIQNLHDRASRWCEAHGACETAVNHAIQSENWARTALLVADAYPVLTAQGCVTTWQRWLKQIPDPYIQAEPALQVRQAWATFLSGEILQAETMLRAARKSLLDLEPCPANQALRGELATYLATISFFREEPVQIIQAAEEALAHLPPEALASRARATSALALGVSLSGDTQQAMRLFHETVELAHMAGNPFFLAHALEIVADGQWHMGQIRAAAATCREIIDLGTKGRSSPLPFAGNGHLKLAGILVEWREFAKAEEAIAVGIALSQQGGIGYNALQDCCSQVRLRQVLGDEEGALTILRQAEQILRHNKSRFMAVQLAACAVQFWLNMGDVKTAVSWAEGQSLTGATFSFDKLPIIGQEVQQVALARVRLAQGCPDEVLAIYHNLHDQAQTAGRMARVIEISLVAALAYQMKGKTAVALQTLQSTLKLTQPEGYLQLFVECGEPMLRLLHQLPLKGQTDYAQTLRQAFSDVDQPPTTTLVEPLSPRELEVLHLIAAGLSNKEIAAELTVTLNTVKKHTSHIYGKLGVNGRVQAIDRAREYHLL